MKDKIIGYVILKEDDDDNKGYLICFRPIYASDPHVFVNEHKNFNGESEVATYLGVLPYVEEVER